MVALGTLPQMAGLRPNREKENQISSQGMPFLDDSDVRIGMCILCGQSPADPEPGYIVCQTDSGDEERIRNPWHVIKARTAIKALVLIEAGYDSNVLDDNGESPSDCAKKGIWPQWAWALGEAGYTWHDMQSKWVKAPEVRADAIILDDFEI